MLTQVDVTTPRGDLLSLPLDDDSSGYRVVGIEGLGPVKATLVSSGFAGLDGEQYQSSRRETRNIKLKMELDPDPTADTVWSLRSKLYDYFMPKSEVSLKFYMDDGLEVTIGGRVESCDPDIFAQEPTIDVSIINFDPDFYDPTPLLKTGMYTTDTNPKSITYKGTVDVGVEIVIGPVNSLGPLSDVTIYHTLPNDETRSLEFVGSLIAGDVLTISTVAGSKGATLTRAGVSSSVLYGISPQSNWIELAPGLNKVKVYSDVVAGTPWKIQYVHKYGGL